MQQQCTRLRLRPAQPSACAGARTVQSATASFVVCFTPCTQSLSMRRLLRLSAEGVCGVVGNGGLEWLAVSAAGT